MAKVWTTTSRPSNSFAAPVTRAVLRSSRTAWAPYLSFWMAEILSGYGHSLSQVGRYDDAQKNLAEAMTLAQELQNKTLIAQIINFQGDAFFYRGDIKSATDLFSKATSAASGGAEKEVVLLSKL